MKDVNLLIPISHDAFETYRLNYHEFIEPNIVKALKNAQKVRGWQKKAERIRFVITMVNSINHAHRFARLDSPRQPFWQRREQALIDQLKITEDF